MTGDRNGTFATGSLTIPYTVTYNSNTYIVTSIGNFAFQGCYGLAGSLTIPNSVTSIGHWLFSDCKGFTGNLIIPNSVISIGNGAFSCCSGFTGNLTIPISVTSKGEDAFFRCTGLTGALTFNAVHCSRDCKEPAFLGCRFSNLIIGEQVTEIPNYMFYECSNLSGSLTILNSVTLIGKEAFKDCSGFSSIYLSANCNTIPTSAFGYCSNVTAIFSPSTTPSTIISGTTLGSIDPTKATLHIPAGTQVLSEYKAANVWKSFINVVQDIDTGTEINHVDKPRLGANCVTSAIHIERGK